MYPNEVWDLTLMHSVIDFPKSYAGERDLQKLDRKNVRDMIWDTLFDYEFDEEYFLWEIEFCFLNPKEMQRRAAALRSGWDCEDCNFRNPRSAKHCGALCGDPDGIPRYPTSIPRRRLSSRRKSHALMTRLDAL